MTDLMATPPIQPGNTAGAASNGQPIDALASQESPKPRSISTRLRSINPVLDRELRQRSRSARSMVIMTIFLLLALGLLYLIYLAETSSSNNPNSLAGTALNSGTGRTMFEWVLLLEMLIIIFVVPGLSAGAISGERDRQTLLPLQVTLLRPRGIFFGKVGAATAFITLIVVASMPLLAVCFLVGGVALKSVVMSVATMIATGFFLAVMGVALSAIFRRTTVAVLASYGLVLFMTVGSGIILSVFSLVFFLVDSPGDELSWLLFTPLYLNPFIALSGAGGVVGSSFDPWPLSLIKNGLVSVEQINNSGSAFSAADTAYVPLWIRGLLAQAVIAGLLALAGLKKLKTPTTMVRE